LSLLAMVSVGCSAPVQYKGDFHFGKDVAESERAPIRDGVEAMKAWLVANGNVNLRELTIVVDSNINSLVSRYDYYNPDGDPIGTAQWLVSGGALAAGSTVYIYTGDEWEDYPAEVKAFVAAHEVFHVAQYGFIVDDYAFDEPGDWTMPPDWLVEGAADFAAARALDDAGIASYSDYYDQTVVSAASYPGSLLEINAPVGDHASGQAAPYALGLIAGATLAHTHGNAALFEFFDLLAESNSWEDAFEATFAEEPASFAQRFDERRAIEMPPHTGGVSGRLVRENGEAVPGASVLACRVDNPFHCESTWSGFDGQFTLGLEPGSYRVSFFVATREGSERGAFTLGDSDEPVEVNGSIVAGLTATVTEPL